MRNLILALFIGAFATGCANISQPRPISDPVEASTALNTMFDEWFELQLERNPIMATAIGDLRYNDQIPNFFAEANRIEAREINQRYLERARGISRDALAGQDRLGWDIFVRDREMAVEAERFPGWMLAVNQFGNYGSFFAQLGSGRSIQPFREPKHYDDFLSRAARFPELTHTAIGNLRAGIAAGVVQPRAVVEKTIPQFAAHVVDDPEQSVYWGPIAALPDTFTVEERERLTAAYRAMIMDTLVPAYDEMRAFLETEYLPAASDKVGMLHLPDGRAWYAFQVKGQTTTDLTPEEIHAFGRFGGYSAFSEGWALYAESLGRELGVFTDPYQWYGRLADEQLRAMRLVVDTGMHYYGWTREEAIDYMKANSSMAETDVIAEVERYIVWPGQALNYKVGERVIRELRNEATAALGDDFDVRAFHREVLTDGALPLQVLQRKIREWIVGANL
ncbi:MAG: DUF885 domain-containing protein [Xanthomonadaceae bacterium]|nr:DUF885 domain-containing protein [Xanthomonadaceae bacterium]